MTMAVSLERDIHMIKMSELYPEYCFDRNKGYGTGDHLNALNKIGPCEIHRKSFSPVSQMSFRYEG